MSNNTGWPCECEHAAHFYWNPSMRSKTPNGNPGHKYGARFTGRIEVKTPNGTFRVCPDCAKDCYAQWAAKA